MVGGGGGLDFGIGGTVGFCLGEELDPGCRGKRFAASKPDIGFW